MASGVRVRGWKVHSRVLDRFTGRRPEYSPADAIGAHETKSGEATASSDSERVEIMSPKPTDMLFTPYMLGDLQLKNRIVMAPLTRTRAVNQGKVPNELMTEYYAQRAGAGLIITEGTFVSEQGQGWYGAPGVYTAEQAAGVEARYRCRSQVQAG